jgi:hypothetical protein
MTEERSRYENSNTEFDSTGICERMGCNISGSEFVKMDTGFYGFITVWACPFHAKELR